MTCPPPPPSCPCSFVNQTSSVSFHSHSLATSAGCPRARGVAAGWPRGCGVPQEREGVPWPPRLPARGHPAATPWPPPLPPRGHPAGRGNGGLPVVEPCLGSPGTLPLLPGKLQQWQPLRQPRHLPAPRLGDTHPGPLGLHHLPLAMPSRALRIAPTLLLTFWGAGAPPSHRYPQLFFSRPFAFLAHPKPPEPPCGNQRHSPSST